MQTDIWFDDSVFVDSGPGFSTFSINNTFHLILQTTHFHLRIWPTLVRTTILFSLFCVTRAARTRTSNNRIAYIIVLMYTKPLPPLYFNFSSQRFSAENSSIWMRNDCDAKFYAPSFAFALLFGCLFYCSNVYVKCNRRVLGSLFVVNHTHFWYSDKRMRLASRSNIFWTNEMSIIALNFMAQTNVPFYGQWMNI